MLTPVRELPSDAPAPRSRVTLGTVALVAFAVLAALALWVATAGAERRGLRQLDPAARAALLERTVANLRTTCARDAPAALSGWCRDQARFALDFDECGGACRATARETLRTPAR
jgi:hypothetical protein